MCHIFFIHSILPFISLIGLFAVFCTLEFQLYKVLRTVTLYFLEGTTDPCFLEQCKKTVRTSITLARCVIVIFKYL